jgi:hypothetical protein
VEGGKQNFSSMGGVWPKFSMEEAKHNYSLHIILPMTWGEKFKAPFQQIKSKEWLGIFVNGSIHSWGTQKKKKHLGLS